MATTRSAAFGHEKQSVTLVPPPSIGSLPGRLQAAFERYFAYIVAALSVADFALAIAVILRVPYTEIDWKAYMQEVSGVVVDGNFDYAELRGDTGPLVYPGGFVWIYAALFYATNSGTNIERAQVVFAILHACMFALAAFIYRMYYLDTRSPRNREGPSSASFPLISVFALLLSRRVMSLFVLRLFNDAIQVLLMFAAVALFCRNRWSLGCLLFSASVSVKMNALLYAPAVALLMFQALGPVHAFWRILVICGGFQIVVGAPFLWHAPKTYILKAFEFNRVFEYKWSVNGAFLSEEAFLEPRLSIGLLAVHLIVLLAFGQFRWTNPAKGGLLTLFAPRPREDALSNVSSYRQWLASVLCCKPRVLRASHIIQCLFACNFIGITFARTLHYQFYTWYFYTLPVLALTAHIPRVLALNVLVMVEVVFNVYPPRATAATALTLGHLSVLSGLWHLPPPSDRTIYTDNDAASRADKQS